MSKTLDIIMSLKDNVSPNLGKINSNLQTTSGKLNACGKSVSKLGGMLKGALVTGAIAKYAYDSLKAYDVQVKAEKGVQRALTATGKTATEASEGLERYKKFASQQQNITAFGDEGTLQVISGLISQGFGEKSIKDIVAMSQDIARSTGDEQENVTKALSAYVKTGKGATKLAKAYKLNADLLGKGKTESERMSEVWKAFSQSDHLGASTEYMKSFTGQVEGLKGRFADLQEPVGNLINTLLGGNSQGLQGSAGAVATLSEAVENATTHIQDLNDRAVELGGGISGVTLATFEAHPIISSFFTAVIGGQAVGAVKSLLETLKPVGSAIVSIGTFCMSAVGGVLALAGAIGSVITALTILIGKQSEYYQGSDEFRARLNQDQMDANGAFASVPAMYQGGKSIFDHNATGTTYFAGGLTSVNENGGEIMNLPNGTQIIPHDISQNMASGGATINCPVTIQGNVIGNESFINEIGNAISSRVSLAIANI